MSLGSKKLPGHNTFIFRGRGDSGDTTDIVFDSDFDSGNCFKVDRVSNLHVTVVYFFLNSAFTWKIVVFWLNTKTFFKKESFTIN